MDVLNRGLTLLLLLALIYTLKRSSIPVGTETPLGASLSPVVTMAEGAVYDQMMLFGDSLFQHSSSQDRGFNLAPALQAEYVRRLDVVNRGFSGYNTDQALKVLSRIIPPPELVKLRFLIIFFGANDACLEGAAGSQHVPVDRYRNNLKIILTHPNVTKQDPRIILVTPPPINEYLAEENDQAKGYMQRRRTAEHTALYAEAVRTVAKDHNVALLDLWQVFMTNAGWKEGSTLEGSKQVPPNPYLRLMLHDGLHFTNIAYALLFQEIIRTIEKHWPDQMANNLPFVLPMWNDPQAWERFEAC